VKPCPEEKKEVLFLLSLRLRNAVFQNLASPDIKCGSCYLITAENWNEFYQLLLIHNEHLQPMMK
jgi:hypothetical protein